MNREIKFRGRTPDGKWLYGDLLRVAGGTLIYYGSPVEAETHELEGVGVALMSNEIAVVVPETVGQFTGLHDINGEEIYEGDLIKAPSGRTYAIIFCKWVHDEKRKFPKVIDRYEHIGWCISLNGKTPCDLLDSEVCQGIIVGNIHDNPEILKGGAQ